MQYIHTAPRSAEWQNGGMCWEYVQAHAKVIIQLWNVIYSE
jgi:hypothetical protein